MTTFLQFQGAVLMLGLLLALVAFMRFRYGLGGGIQRGRFTWREFWQSEFGVFAVQYNFNGGNGGPGFPNFGTATPPTAQQASQMAEQIAIVSFADADVTGTIVHNWGAWFQQNVPQSYANNSTSFATLLLPKITVVCLNGTASAPSFATNFTFGLTNSNQVTMNKIGNGTGSGGSFAVYLQRALAR